MAYITYITEIRELTEAESTAAQNYMAAQINAGTTDGNKYVLTSTQESPTQNQTINIRIWGTSESAAGYKSLFEGFSPAVPIAMY